MTLVTALTLFAAMVVLAMLPGPGILVVVARSLSGGINHGIATSIGIVAGDYVFIILSVFGLASLAQTMGDLFVFVRYAGAIYLIYLGVSILRSSTQSSSSELEGNLVSSKRHSMPYSMDFVAGLLTTLSNPKAILFYLSFFPAFLDLSTLRYDDLIFILLITTFAVGGTMIAYSYVSVKAQFLLADKKRGRWINRVSSGLLVGSGLFLMFRSS
jgi:threonine/homoserine/homoserine lactone efflux protein